MAAKPSIPKGTRDFSPVEMAKRNYIFNTIRDVYHLYGFQQIETPAMEMLDTLEGKYGEEGDKLLFRVLESGDFIEKIKTFSKGLSEDERRSILTIEDSVLANIISLLQSEIESGNNIIHLEKKCLNIYNDKKYEYLLRFLLYKSLEKEKNIYSLKNLLKNITPKKIKKNIETSIRLTRAPFLNSKKLQQNISYKGLRYDLTVPFARYVVMHRDEISFPFKRYQIQPVWRADRPQKGRYREFYQCDADVVGSDSLLNEVELMQIVDQVFTRFGIRVCIKINNRKILTGIAEIIGEADKIVDITVAIDKLDKIGLENVNKELSEKGISDEAIIKLQPIILLNGTNAEKLSQLKSILAESETGVKGVEESEFILTALETMGLKNEIELDLTLARGLSYYTGAIFEVKALDVQIGSITGGGRYDNLTGVFGLSGVSGVGISFGADRIFDVLNQLELYPKEAVNGTRLFFVNFGEKEAAYCLPVLAKVRNAGINAEIFPDSSKMKKQMSYANAKNIPFVAIVGENEMNEGKIMLKNMETGEQQLVSADELIAAVQP